MHDYTTFRGRLLKIYQWFFPSIMQQYEFLIAEVKAQWETNLV